MEEMNILKAYLESKNIQGIDDMLRKFSIYMAGVLEWNEKVNLTSITEPTEFVVKHFIDSLICTDFPEYEEASKVIDVGTGGGFPGIPLAIISPQKEFVLMDSLGKRLRIIDELCRRTDIGNATTIHARAEELARSKAHREQYDLCVCRAVAGMAVLAEYCLPFIKVGGFLMAYKGPDAEKEAVAVENVLSLLGGRVEDIRRGNIEEFGIDHKVVVIKKIKSTPSKFPRKAGTPTKEPLK